jgi:hypothetical protein
MNLAQYLTHPLCRPRESQGHPRYQGGTRQLLRFTMAIAVLPLVLAGCAPMTHSMISLDESGSGDLSTASILTIDFDSPVVLRGVDNRLLPVRVPSAFRDWSFVISPGKHLLWVSSVPYPHPLFPQRIRCFVLDVSLDPGIRYILRYDLGNELALIFRQGGTQPEATGRLVDKPLVFDQECKWL